MMKKNKMKQVNRTYNSKIEFGKYETIRNENGMPEKTFVHRRFAWANITGLRGTEFYQASAVQAQDDKKFYCRFFEGLDTRSFIKYQGKVYNIFSVDNINEANFEYEIRAREVEASE